MYRVIQRIDMASIDRISALPDDVLVYILSFLTTKTSVSTSILSRRWRFLWAVVPTFDFDADDYVSVTTASLRDIIYEVLFLHKGHSLHTFRLDLRQYQHHYSELERWISAAISRNVRNIDIRQGDLDYDVYMFPKCLFTCKTLVDLSLRGCGIVPVYDHVSLPLLKKLHLDMVKYDCDESLAHVLSGTPVLEELIIHASNYMELSVWGCISSPTLIRLVLWFEINLVEDDDEAFRVEIDTPALRYLTLHDRESQFVSVGHLTSLFEADISFYDKKFRGVLDSRNVIEFVGKLYNVKCLTLSTGCMMVPNSAFSGLTAEFHNLTELELCADSFFITYFLENADNLRSLTINMDDKKLKYWMEPKHIPASLISHLETVRFKCFRCTKVGFEMIRYILRNAKVLKMIEVSFHLSFDLEEKTEACRRISLFERGSEACLLDMH